MNVHADACSLKGYVLAYNILDKESAERIIFAFPCLETGNMGPHYLDRLFAPRTIAVFGAADRKDSVAGRAPLNAMLDAKEMETEKEEWIEFIESVKHNVRQHAGYFTWLTDRSIEEVGVVQSLHESLEKRSKGFFHSYKSRGANNDPPDCEALSLEGEKIGIEVTELVDGDSIAASKRKQPELWEPWKTSELYELLRERIKKKDDPSQVKGGPYSQYTLIIYSDEPRILDYELIESVRACIFGPTRLLDRVIFLLSYNPWEKCCPYIELRLDGH